MVIAIPLWCNIAGAARGSAAVWWEVSHMPHNVWPNFVVEALLIAAFIGALVLRYPDHG